LPRLREHNQVINLDANAKLLAERMIVMAGRQAEHARAARQFQRVEKLGAAERLGHHLGVQGALIVVQNVIRPQQEFQLATDLAPGGNCPAIIPSSVCTCPSFSTSPGRITPWPMKSATKRLPGRW